LGATGVSGLIAVTAAKRLGAGRVVAAGRNRAALERAKRLGADRTLELAASDLVAAHRDAADGTIDVRVDFVSGAPGEAAPEVVATHGRLVHIGARAGRIMTVSGATIRRTSADIMGFAYYHPPMDLHAQAYVALCRLAAA